MKKETKTLAIIVIAVFTLIVCVVGATYAYFTAQMGSGQSVNINANTATTDSLKFEDGKNLVITANQENFGEGKGNQTDNTTVSAKVVANNTTNSASFNYNVYLNILSNELQYTTEEKTAELLLQVIDPEDNVVTTIPGLNYVTVGDVSGFDITEETDIITIASNYEIKAEAGAPTAEKTDEWEVTLVLVNLDSNQNENTGKQFIAKVLIGQEEAQSTLAATILKTYGTDPTLLHHDATLENGANDGSYRYSGANSEVNNYVCFGTDAEECPRDNLYRIIGVFGDTVKVIKDLNATKELLGEDGDFSTEAEVTTDIMETANKAGYVGNMALGDKVGLYYWNGPTDKGGTANNNWEKSRLNTINLNTNYLNNIGSEWSNKIKTTTWSIGGMTFDNGAKSNAKIVYDYELGENKDNATYDAKIGMIYLSEYYYAANPTYWTLPGYDENGNYNDNIWVGEDYSKSIRDNWIMPFSDWTNSRVSVHSVFAFRVAAVGSVGSFIVYDYDGVRPSFNLESSVKVKSGSGSMTDPYRIS